MKVISITELENIDDVLLDVVERLKKGQVIVVPTDTVYGLVADASNEAALDQIFKIKNRPYEKKLPLFVKDTEFAKKISWIPTNVQKLLEKVWPGAVTIVVATKDSFSDFVSENKTVALRVPDHIFVRRLVNMLGRPIAATSANISGDSEDLTSIEKVVASFRDAVWKPDLIISSGNLPTALPSTIIDFSHIKPRIIREGDISIDEIKNLFT